MKDKSAARICKELYDQNAKVKLPETRIEELEAAARELSIAFAQVPVDWDCDWAKETAERAVNADKKLRALLEAKC